MFGQVGINTQNPSATLEVNGDMLVREKLYLEGESLFGYMTGAKMLVEKTDDTWANYDIAASKYGPINYVQVKFARVSPYGLQDYNTKISTDKYIVSVQGVYYLKAGSSTDANVFLESNKSGLDNIEGPQFYAYEGPGNNWYIKGFVNNSTFKGAVGNNMTDINIDLYMNIIIYRRDFIAKKHNTIQVNLGGSETGTANKPSGF